MKQISKSDLNRKNDRELAAMVDELRKDIAQCERQRRQGYSAIADIRKLQAQRRAARPGMN